MYVTSSVPASVDVPDRERPSWLCMTVVLVYLSPPSPVSVSLDWSFHPAISTLYIFGMSPAATVSE